MVAFRMKDGTGTIDLRFTYEDTDRHGNVRVYVRRFGMKKVRLRQTPGTPEFLEEYRDAIAGRLAIMAKQTAARVPATKGTLRWLCEQYFGSAEFKGNPSRNRLIPIASSI